MKHTALIRVAAIGLLVLVGIQGAQAAPAVIVLWPNGAPGAKGSRAEDVPQITVYPPTTTASSGTAMVVCPGGGYVGLSDSEGAPIAGWLNTLGITAFVLRYRLGPRYHHPAMLQDVSRAVRTVRYLAAQWNVDPRKVGVIGFSAGGHLASTVSTHFDAGDPSSSDPIEQMSSRPALAVLVYPVITMTEPLTHQGSRDNLLGTNPSAALVDLLSNEKQVTRQTPPAFVVAGSDDTVVPIENSLMYSSALRKAGVPFELHVYQHGDHGFALAQGDAVLGLWPDACAHWLRMQGFVKSGRDLFRLYDVDGDGHVTLGDAVLALRIALGRYAATDAQRRAADVNGDGRVTTADAVAILRQAIGV